MLLENVTIIIPAHNRPERLQRLLNYYSKTAATILVPDSSTQVFTGQYDPLTTCYIHRPGLHFLYKIKEVLPMIKTPYVLYCADDDFAVPQGIAQVTQFLDKHPDYSVAQGHYLTFVPRRGGKISFTPRYIRHFDSHFTAETPSLRLCDPTPQYASTLYGVVRSDVFKKMYSYCFDANGKIRFSNLFLAEEFFCHAVRMFGKYATIPCFYSARENIPGSATSTTVPQSVVKTADAYKEEYNNFISALTQILIDLEPTISAPDAEALVRRANTAPLDSRQVELKRRVISFCSRRWLLSPLVKLANYRYKQKGLKAVKGMPSYPCTTPTPDILDIINSVNTSR